MNRFLLALAALFSTATALAAQTPAPAPAPAPVDTAHLYYLRQLDRSPALRNSEQIVRRIARVYPDSLKAQGVSGTVMLRFVVNARGEVEPGSVEVVSSTHPGFEAPARETVEQMQFVPGELQGRPVRVSVVLPLEFALRH